MEKSCYKSPIGNIEIICNNNKLISLKLTNNKNVFQNETDFIKNVKSQLHEYFSGKRKCFDIRIKPQGTAFQKAVWNEITKIPHGSIKTYSEIALSLGNKNAQRAIGNACNKNPIMIIIPCHRVISKSGKTKNFAFGIETKQKLLNLEQFS